MKRLLLLPILMLGLSFSQNAADDLDVVISKGLSMMNYCGSKTTICPGSKPSRDRYLGMEGKLTSLEPSGEEFGKNIFEIKMTDGSFLYYSTRSKSPFADEYGPAKLSGHKERLSRVGSSVVDGSSIIIEDVFLDESGIGYKYVLSTGNEVWGDTLSDLEKILLRVPSDREAEFVGMINDLTLKYDDMEDVFFISINDVSLYNASKGVLPVKPYIVLKDDGPILRTIFYYKGSGWLFVDRVLVRVGDKRVNFDGLNFSRDNSGYSVWEWYDKIATQKEIELLNSILSESDVNVRFYGKQSYSDETVTEDHRNFIQNIMTAYEIFK